MEDTPPENKTSITDNKTGSIVQYVQYRWIDTPPENKTSITDNKTSITENKTSITDVSDLCSSCI